MCLGCFTGGFILLSGAGCLLFDRSRISCMSGWWSTLAATLWLGVRLFSCFVSFYCISMFKWGLFYFWPIQDKLNQCWLSVWGRNWQWHVFTRYFLTYARVQRSWIWKYRVLYDTDWPFLQLVCKTVSQKTPITLKEGSPHEEWCAIWMDWFFMRWFPTSGGRNPSISSLWSLPNRYPDHYSLLTSKISSWSVMTMHSIYQGTISNPEAFHTIRCI